jgi:SanA protein
MRLSLYVLLGLGAGVLIIVLLAWFAERRLEQLATSCLTDDPSRLPDMDVAPRCGGQAR